VLVGLVAGKGAWAGRVSVSYLKRVVVALGDQFLLPDWSPETLAEATRSQLNEAQVREIAAQLGAGSLNLLHVARLLGYQPDGTGWR
jgi:hypothetical protein